MPVLAVPAIGVAVIVAIGICPSALICVPDICWVGIDPAELWLISPCGIIGVALACIIGKGPAVDIISCPAAGVIVAMVPFIGWSSWPGDMAPLPAIGVLEAMGVWVGLTAGICVG